jgi:hypothetical protein
LKIEQQQMEKDTVYKKTARACALAVVEHAA